MTNGRIRRSKRHLFYGRGRSDGSRPGAPDDDLRRRRFGGPHFSKAEIVPLHFEGWAHFTESRRQIREAFATAGRRTVCA